MLWTAHTLTPCILYIENNTPMPEINGLANETMYRITKTSSLYEKKSTPSQVYYTCCIYCTSLGSRQLSNPPLQLWNLSQLHIQLILLILQLESPLGIELGEDVVSLAIELKNVRVVLPQTAAVTDRHEGDSEGLGVVVHDLFRI